MLESTAPARSEAVAPAAARADHVLLLRAAWRRAFGAPSRSFDARGRRVDDDRVGHPGGAGDRIAVGLRPGLPDGTYTATYRVISADGHPVSGGLVFSVGAKGTGPAASVDALLAGSKDGPVTKAAAAGARAVLYASIAVAAGLLLFLGLCWRPALRRVAGPEPRWRAASEALGARATRVGLVAALLGLLGGAASLVAEGATGSGSSFWAALSPGVLTEVAGTRTGRVLVGQCAASLFLAGAFASRGPRRAVVTNPGAPAGEGPGRLPLLALGVPAALLVLSPALEGHQITQHPIWANLALDVVHVTAITTWLGGIVALLLVLPAATRRLDGPDRTRLLAAVLVRFSPAALACVLLIAASGTAAAILELHRFGDLLHSGYGRAILVKATLLLVLVGLGAINRQRVVPRLRRLAEDAGPAPGAAGSLLRRTLRGELIVLAVVLVATGVLVGSSPPGARAGGPDTARAAIGPDEVIVSVDPARTGPNRLHVDLSRRGTGAPATDTRELTVTAVQPKAGIGPLPITLRASGPGRYTTDAATFVPGGTWELTVVDRVSEFDEYQARVEVEIR